ncbi:hypothetical protein Acj61p024 [Acinetobacter phage Acj61]|uniref:Uncharacterized protein n=1 Tax=Acinetobacter phage Acj61 TaxID=760732 RepID=E5E405_9CAUD|nr:hypothetical protein Acj61p024 [Acinetobacter phage Acj61]ADG35989.1 hypothetical protein Acj61p024 [Acinetobacter phage Acj61]
MAENERLGAIMNTEIVKFKRIVKNIIAGNNVSRAEIMNLYKETVQEQVEKRVETLFKAFNVKSTIENLVRSETKKYLNDLMNKERGYWASNRTDVERIIQEECDKQIREIIRENFTINLSGKEVKFGD